MKALTKASFWLVVIGAGAYFIRKGFDVISGIGGKFPDIDGELEEFIEGLYEPEERLEGIAEYFGSKGCDYDSMKMVIDGDSSLIPSFLRKFMPSSVTAQQYVSAMWNWASNVEIHSGKLSEDTRWANAWAWVVTQFAQTNSYMDENDLRDKELFT